ncbi:unnamed protein product [Brassicogethes aeneus]|uniref:RWD domain-containing protein n=1 Tax=Brassicogethes aeneus TaxID=1431903 RepID=A0A9P0B6X8_BRAAE|nr:unnamed protein product [Brassicogethes aeneus]
MSDAELQEEEREALSSIYDGDENFKQINTTTYQYKYGESDTPKSFIVEIKWEETYPTDLPVVNMETFYNKHIHPFVKAKVISLVKEEAEQFLGMSMTYSLFEFVKEKFEDLMKEQPEETEIADVDRLKICEELDQQESVKKEKKEQLTKAQKRRQWNRTDAKGEKPRGWNWVDLVKHLSQTGYKDDPIGNS